MHKLRIHLEKSIIDHEEDRNEKTNCEEEERIKRRKTR
jgi:hypothetical protein